MTRNYKNLLSQTLSKSFFNTFSSRTDNIHLPDASRLKENKLETTECIVENPTTLEHTTIFIIVSAFFFPMNGEGFYQMSIHIMVLIFER